MRFQNKDTANAHYKFLSSKQLFYNEMTIRIYSMNDTENSNISKYCSHIPEKRSLEERYGYRDIENSKIVTYCSHSVQ